MKSLAVRKLDLSLYQKAISAFDIGNKKIFIKQDDYSEDPLNWGHFEFFSTHTQYYADQKYKVIKAKDGCFYGIDEFENLKAIEEFLKANDYLFCYVHLYEHSGFKIWTSQEKQTPSGCFGFLYVSKEQVRRSYGVKRITKKIQDQVYDHMSSFASNEWEQYFNGDTYQYIVMNNNDEFEDCLCGFYGLESLRDHLSSEYQIQMPII